MKYWIQNRETGTKIELASNLAEAKRILKKYEEADRFNGDYTPDFYEIEEA